MRPALPKEPLRNQKIYFVVNDLRYFLSHRLHILEAAKKAGAQVAIIAPRSELDSDTFPYPRIFWSLRPRGKNPFLEMWSIWQLAKIYRREKPDILHHFTIKPVLYGSLVAGLCGRNIVVNSISGLGSVFGVLLRKKSWISQIPLRFVSMCLRAGAWSFIFQCEEDRRAFAKAGFLKKAKQVLLLPGTGIALDRFPKREALDRSPLNVLFVGRMLVRKGVKIFMELAEQCSLGKLPLRFTIIGPVFRGSRKECVSENELQEWQSHGYGEYLGYREDLSPFLYDADVLVLPSTYEEGLPRIVLEAAAAGVAVITSDIPSLRGFFRTGEELLISRNVDIAEIQQHLEALQKSFSFRAALTNSARSVVEQDRFRPEHFEQATLNLYRLLFASSKL